MFLAIESVKEAFDKSRYREFEEEFERFFIFQGYYSFLAYVAFVREKHLKKEMLDELERQLDKYGISKIKIIRYERFTANYLFSLPMNKQIYYALGLIHHKLIQLI